MTACAHTIAIDAFDNYVDDFRKESEVVPHSIFCVNRHVSQDDLIPRTFVITVVDVLVMLAVFVTDLEAATGNNCLFLTRAGDFDWKVIYALVQLVVNISSPNRQTLALYLKSSSTQTYRCDG